MTHANKLTLLRMALSPLFVAALLVNNVYAYWAALVILGLAALTDLIDGRLARRTDTRTTFGEYADPLADKLFVLTALVTYSAVGIVPVWLTLVVLWRELVVTTLRAFAGQQGEKLTPNRLGKAKTMLQMLAVLAVLLWQTARATLPWAGAAWTPGLEDACYWACFGLTALAALQALLSGVSYLWAARHLLRRGLSA